MGKKDIGLKSYLQNTARYADLWNGSVFRGKQVVKAEELREITPVRSKSDKQAVLERTGDLVMKQNYDGQRFVVLSLENQEEIDYEMPVRIMLQEALEYDRQIREIRRENERAYKEYKEARARNNEITREVFYRDAGEYLYKVKKDDRLFPVATLVVYWGKERWKGPRSLHEMIDFGSGNTVMGKELRNLIPEYPLHFLDLSSFEHFEYFKTELRPLFELFQRCDSREKTMEYLEQDEVFQVMDHESWYLLGQLTNFKNIESFVRQRKQKSQEEKRMVLDDIIDEAKAKGEAEGRAKGEAEGRAKGEAEGRAKGEAEGRAKGEAEGRAKGEAEGRVQGKAEGRAESIVEILKEYGPIQNELKEEILRQTNLQILSEWLKLAVRAKSVDEFAQKIHV